MRSCASQRPSVPADTFASGGWVARYRTSSARLQRASDSPCWQGRLHASAVACARSVGGKTPRCARAWGIRERVCFDPAATPFAHHPITGAQRVGNVVIRPVRLFKSGQNNPRTEHLGLWGRMCAYDLAQVGRGVVGQCDGIVWSRSTHHCTSEPHSTHLAPRCQIRNRFMIRCTKRNVARLRPHQAVSKAQTPNPALQLTASRARSVRF